jgi:tRNA pseudouridine38-40 synthase
VRTITRITVTREEDEIRIRVSGKGFLYNMVRILSGTLIEIGNGKYPPEKIVEILEAKNRSAAGPTAPAQGLTLVGIRFEEK